MTEAGSEAGRIEAEALAAFRRGALAESIEGFASARAAYASSRDSLKAAEMANNLSVALLQAGRMREAVEAVRGTPEIFQQAGDRAREAQAWGNLASALEASHMDGAAESYRRASDLFRALGDTESVALVQRSLSAMQLRQGKPLEAIASMQQVAEGPFPGGLRGRLLRWLLRLPFVRGLIPPRT